MITADASSFSGISATVDHLALLGLAIMQIIGMWWAKKNHERSQHEIAEVKIVAGEIKKTVNGPLGNALAATASAQEALARLTQNPERILEAVASRKLSNEHIQNKIESDAEAKKSQAAKKAIIDQFLAGRGER